MLEMPKDVLQHLPTQPVSGREFKLELDLTGQEFWLDL
jgi:hypothetical protein